MTVSRRAIVGGLASVPFVSSLSAVAQAASAVISPDRFDPWIEVDSAALIFNAKTVSRLAGGRPILAVIKNNAYGLGLATVASVLEPLTEVKGFAVVKAAEAIALRDAGVTKPILLLALFSDRDGVELANRNIQFSLCTDDAGARVMNAAKNTGRRPQAQFYLDTGMSRMGIPYHRALPVLEEMNKLEIDIKGTLTGFTEETEFDTEQLRRFTEFTDTAKQSGVELGPLHAASSHAVFNYSDAHLDQVRPGIALFGAYPSDAESERAIAALRPAVRLQARIVRTERLRAGDSVSYGGHYVASKPTWVATVPAGHTDGIPRTAVDGSHAVVNGTAYPIIGAVSASHTIIEVGDEPAVRIGDLVTLMGPDHAAIHPNALASVSNTSVYDRLMHLNPSLPKVLV
jgi:alanine racemase